MHGVQRLQEVFNYSGTVDDLVLKSGLGVEMGLTQLCSVCFTKLC